MRKVMVLLVLVLSLSALGVASASAAIVVGTTGIRPQTDQNAPGAVEAFQTTASATATVGSMTVYVNSTSTAAKVTVGLYADNNGHPGALLTQGSKTAPTTGAYNDITVPSASVTSGSSYWIALLGTGGGPLTFRDQANAGKSETYAISGQTAMPATWQTGTTYKDANLSAYASTATATQPVLGVTPTSLSFTATTGGSDPATKTAAISNTGTGTLSFTTSGAASWLGVSPTSGTAPATVTFAPHISGLTAGTYDSTVTITAAGATGSPATVAVHLTVTNPAPPVLSVTPTSLSFTATTGGSDPATKTAAISNTGTGTLSFTTSGAASWLGVSPTSGTAPATVTFAPHISGLTAGTYDSTVTITAAGATGSPATVAVHLTVSDPTPPPTGNDWLQVDHDAARTGNATGETILGVTQAPTLGQSWATVLDGKITAQPLYAGGVTVGGQTHDIVVVTTSGGSVYAVDASTGVVLWRRALGAPTTGNCAIPGGFGIVAPAAIDKARGRIYTVTENGALRTLAIGDGSDAAPAVSIITNAATNRVWGGPTLVSSSTLYVATASDGCDTAPWRGRVLKVDIGGATPSLTKEWDVVNGIAAPNGGGGIWGYGGVSADTATGNVFAATGADSIEQYTTYADRLVALSSNLDVLGSIEPYHPTSFPCAGDPCDVDFGSTPAVFTPTGCSTMVAAGNKNGILYVAKESTLATSGAAEQALQLNPANDWLGSGGIGGVPAWSAADQMLYVSDVGDGFAGVAGGVVGLKVGADCKLSVAWSQPLGGGANPDSTPTVANGVVYVAEGNTGKIAAYNAQTGQRLYLSNGGGAGYAAPIVANGTVYQTTWDGFTAAATGTLRAYRAGASPPPPPPPGSLLLGVKTVGGQQDQNTDGNAEAFQSTASSTGTLSTLSIYLDSGSTAAKVTAGVYTDTGATKPGTLLAQGSSTALTPGAWNTITIPATSITAGTPYWIAILGSTGGTIRFRDVPGGCHSESSASSSLTALPATWATGSRYTDCPLSAYGNAGG